MNNPSKKDNLTKKAISPACEMYPNVSCAKEAYRYFSGRTRISLWFLADIIVPQVIEKIFKIFKIGMQIVFNQDVYICFRLLQLFMQIWFRKKY